MSRLQKMIGILGFVFALGFGPESAVAECPAYPSGFTCECNDDDTEWICAKWAAPGTPAHNSDFTVAYVSGAPNVTLSTADLGWELYSEVISSSTPADIGSITLSNSTGDDFEVTIAKGTGTGATKVGTINLDDTGFTGYSSIKGGSISEDLIGDLTVVQDSGGNGGVISGFVIGGDLSGNISAAVVVSLTIIGDLSENFSINISKEVSGKLSIKGDVSSTGSVHIEDLASYAKITLGSSTTTFAGLLDLLSGIPANTTVEFLGEITSMGNIDLNAGDVAGLLQVFGDNAGDVLAGGAVTGDARLTRLTGKDYSGSATFASVSSTGSINAVDLSGAITVTGAVSGTVAVGNVLASGSIYIGGTVSGDVNVGNDVSGVIDVGSLEGDVDIDGDVTLTGRLDVHDIAGVGRILIDGVVEGDVRVIWGTDSLTLIHVIDGIRSSGTIEINALNSGFDANGDIYIGPVVGFGMPDVSFDGCIRVYDEYYTGGWGDLNGDITVAGCHATSDDLNICVDGTINGDITIIQAGCTNSVGWSCSGCP